MTKNSKTLGKITGVMAQPGIDDLALITKHY